MRAIAAAIFYLFAALAAFVFLSTLSAVFTPERNDPGFAWIQLAEMAALAAVSYLTARGLRRERPWASWAGYAIGGLLLFIFPVGTAAGLLIIGILFRADRGGAPVSAAILLPSAFLMIVVPLAAFIVSGAGTHMSSLMLIPFASPWWILLPNDRNSEEIRSLLAGCGVNAALLALAGWFVDRRRERATRQR